MAKTFKPLSGLRDAEGLEGDNQFIMSLAKGLELLRVFDPALGALANSDLARLSGLPKPTIARITHTLTRLGYLEYLPRLERYRLGPGVLALGHSYIGTLDVNAVASSIMSELALKYDMTLALGVRDRVDIVYTEVAYGTSLRGIRLDVGARVPIALSAIGMAYLHAVDAQQRQYLTQELKLADPERWPELERQIARTGDEIERRSFCVVAGRYDPHIIAAATAVPNLPGSPPLVLNASVQEFRPQAKLLPTEIGTELVAAARQIGDHLFRRGDRS